MTSIPRKQRRHCVSSHTFRADQYTLWADRVRAIHGRVSIFTLWEKTPDGHQRLIGGVTSDKLRLFIKENC